MKIPTRRGIPMCAEEINDHLKKGGHAFLTLDAYTIEGVRYSASGLTLGDDTLIYEKEDHFVVPTYFRRELLAHCRSDGDPNEKIRVDVIVDPKDIWHVSIIPIRNQE